MTSQRTILRMNEQIDRQCPICQCDMLLPVPIPACNHTFCYPCLKGVSMQNMDCPICRGPIDHDSIVRYKQPNIDLKMPCPLDSPQPIRTRPNNGDANQVVVKDEPIDEDVKPDINALRAGTSNNAAVAQNVAPPPAQNYWLYQGRSRGWWRFDPRTEKDIEEASSNNMPITEVVICGSRYIIDFSNSIQYPKDKGINMKRNIRRVTSAEFDSLHVKGIAGVSK
ncbi:unnamed protein product [Caenorhabditis angaria]|uniref:E3 ubiquitin-protein ligase n=1 Tax=Caenorhabditis angaria TaxID=860376 RepID=A0A9P1MWM9_9PELO|nr:unnamed protein product [Caenorhabditis angaria]